MFEPCLNIRALCSYVQTRAKAECVPECRRELLKCDVIVEAVYGDNYWSCGLKTHDVSWANEKDWPGKYIIVQLHRIMRQFSASKYAKFCDLDNI